MKKEGNDIRAWRAARALAGDEQRAAGRAGAASRVEKGDFDYSIDVRLRAEGYQRALDDLAAGRLQ